jgi:putative transposase
VSYLQANSVIRSVSSPGPFNGTYRIVLVNQRADSLWTIQISRTDRGSISYHRMPRHHSMRAIESLIRRHSVDIVEDAVPAEWMLSDAQIQARYGRANEGQRCSQLTRRDGRWAVIEPIVTRHTPFELLECGCYQMVVAARAAELGLRVKNVAAILHLYWTGGGNVNALLPRFHNSGARGKARIQRKKLGRPNIAVKNCYPELEGFLVTEEDRKRLHFGWETFVRPGRTVTAAYMRTMEAFYRVETASEHGVPVPILKPAHERPTLRQFRYWGKSGNALRSATYLQLPEGDFERDFRALAGTARDGITAVGQLAYCDATSNDAHLMSVVSRIKPVGPLSRIMIVEGLTTLWAGVYCGFSAPSAKTALMAVANAALDKVDFCARFDIEISSDMWPAISFSRYLGDNGEFRCEVCKAAISGLGSTLEFAPTGRADSKGPVESNHHQLHARLDHKLDGTTHGRARQRGEDHPAIDAGLTYFEYMRHLIRRIIYYNNHERCDHLLTTEMRRDGVPPNRVSIYRWCVENGYVAGAPPSPDTIRAHLLPVLPAVLTGSGIYLVRPDRGRKIELIKGARFVGDVLLQKGLMLRARGRHEQVQVRGDPEDLSRVWFIEEGVHELKNVSTDSLAVREWTLADHLCVQDGDALNRHLVKSDQDQAESALDAALFADMDKAREEKKVELERQKKPLSKKQRTVDIRRNRDEEKELILQVSNEPDQAPLAERAVAPAGGPVFATGSASRAKAPSPTLDLLRRFGKSREAK